MKTEFINTVTAKNEFNALIATINKTKTPIIVAKRGQPVAVLLDFESFQEMGGQSQDSNDSTLIKRLRAFHKHLAKELPESRHDDSVHTLRHLRLERHK